MKMILTFILLAFSIQAFACPLPLKNLIPYYKKEFLLGKKTEVLISDFTVDGLSGKKLNATHSCGIQGCDYLLFVESTPHCYSEALSFSGKVLPDRKSTRLNSSH